MKRAIIMLLLTVSGSALFAQNPGAEQDAIAERQRILRTADQIDLLVQQNTQLSQQIAALQERVAKLEAADNDLKNQLTQQQKDWAAEREKLLKEVAKIVAGNGGKTAATESSPSAPMPPPVRQEAGYEYVVQQGQSLWAIADAYQKNGVNVTVDDIRKANNLKDDMLKVGQKLFIPKK